MNIHEFVKSAPVGKQLFATKNGYDILLYKAVTPSGLYNFEAVVIRSAESTIKMQVEVWDSGLNFWTILLNQEVNCFCPWEYFETPVLTQTTEA